MTSVKICSLFCSLFVLFAMGKAEFTSVIFTHNGPVRGQILTTIENSMPYASFKGIPYAEPPLNKLRFQPPTEKEPWTNVLDALQEGSMCTQYNSTSSTVVGSEDCLYLNVFTPHTKFNSPLAKPVIVWIHGGAYRTGNANASYYGPDFLLQEDVIVVSMNYRLGALGFLSLNHEKATGNYGLKDQNLALKWVQKNIANFGGDPNQVTIFGQSAGSVAVDLHILSDMSSGLFKQSIGMSGSTLCLYWGIQSPSEAERKAFALGSMLGNKKNDKDELLETLYNASAHDIVKNTNEMQMLPFRPIIENDSIAKHQEKFLTKCSLMKYAVGNYNKGPHLMGYTEVETVAFAASIGKLLAMVNAALELVKSAALSIQFPFLSKIAHMEATGISNLTEAALSQLTEETSDIFFATGIDIKQQLLRIHNKHPIYYYHYTFDPLFSAHRTEGVDLKGAAHEDELPYFFYRPHINLPLEEPTIKMTRKRVVRMWTNFAKYGNPTPPEITDELSVVWPDSGILGKHLEIGENLSIKITRPTDKSIKAYQLAGLGSNPLLNHCATNVLPDFGSLFGSITGHISSFIPNNLYARPLFG